MQIFDSAPKLIQGYCLDLYDKVANKSHVQQFQYKVTTDIMIVHLIDLLSQLEV